MKRILDTVHGYIMVDEKFIRYIIDTRHFQRLRRIEQTSIRSVYPSARHDRFIHSLGVFHIGSLIVDHLKKEEKANEYWGENETTMRVIYDSYLAACLLHDVGHAPFSHTFERYYGQKSRLEDLLNSIIQNEDFKNDLVITRREDDPNFHEFMSAYIAYKTFGTGLRRMSLDPEFVVRMIIGNFYSTKKEENQIHNCFISLLHSRVIDADRLDYACRDVWASGYSTSSVDLRRLISALHIHKNDEGDYVVCYEANSLNEIEGVLNVKDFQVKYVINHHTVSYDQWLLTNAAEHMAIKFFPDKDGSEALGMILNEKAIMDGIDIPEPKMRIWNISDDDLVFLMKQDTDNTFYKEWSSREYTHYPLWKSPDEFYHYFPSIERAMSLKHSEFNAFMKELLAQKLQINSDDVIITTAMYKPRVKMDSLYLLVAGELVRYTDLFPKSSDENEDIEFYYVFIPKKREDDYKQLCEQKKCVIDSLRSVIPQMYAKQQEQQ